MTKRKGKNQRQTMVHKTLSRKLKIKKHDRGVAKVAHAPPDFQSGGKYSFAPMVLYVKKSTCISKQKEQKLTGYAIEKKSRFGFSLVLWCFTPLSTIFQLY